MFVVEIKNYDIGNAKSISKNSYQPKLFGQITASINLGFKIFLLIFIKLI